ncbi:MAG: hypothetical protein ABR981_04020 [Candidatus Micrarchaeaceae archaeon]|jgi:hypothetical protein
MATSKLETKFEPAVLKANKRNETTMHLSLASGDQKVYWCECDILVSPPLSLAHDKELNIGRTRIGILKPNKKIDKQIKLYTMPNNFPDFYQINITVYLYDEDGVIAERVEQSESIKCE